MKSPPDRARPLTPHEPLMYRSTLQEFIDYAHGITGNPKNQRIALSSICEVTSEFVSGFIDYLKTTKIAVDTHNRRLRRLMLWNLAGRSLVVLSQKNTLAKK